jgi:hypothetical protein
MLNVYIKFSKYSNTSSVKTIPSSDYALEDTEYFSPKVYSHPEMFKFILEQNLSFPGI